MSRHFSCVWLFVTLWTVAHEASMSMGFSRQEYWSGSPFPPPGDLLDLRIKPASLLPFALSGEFFTTSTIWEASQKLANHLKLIHKSSNTPIKRVMLTSPFFCGSWKLITKLEKAYTENWFIKDVALQKSGERVHNWWIKNGLDLGTGFIGCLHFVNIHQDVQLRNGLFLYVCYAYLPDRKLSH